MSSRNRQSTARPTASRQSGVSTPSRNAAADTLPPYKKPSHPLDTEATRALRELQGRSLNDVKRHSKQAAAAITASAENVNDTLRDHAEYIARRRKKWDAGKNLEDRDVEERDMEELRLKVEEATAKLEESMRAVIDSGVAAQRIDDTLDWLRTHAPITLEEEYRTQMTQRETQRQSQSQTGIQRRTRNIDGDGDTEMDEGPTPGPTPIDGSRMALTGASELFASRVQREKDTYTSLSLTARYARNNEYRDFKRIVHDAKYGDNGPVLGHEDTWFTETGSPAPGITDSTQRGDFDDDDDIVVDRATISTRCPITYQQFKEPYSSNKCPHTFEKNAILEMIRRGPHRIGQQKAVDCPVAGCNQMLTETDVHSNKVLIRKIRRMQEAELAEAEESSEDEMQAPSSDRQSQPMPSGSAGDRGDVSDASDGELSA
ncbi:hypothetical protein COCMIDRAFT_99172 [Bipolaris oryzae ATCC 44560]|uniref:SP-RING-type domain-containing protein n=1 Tax=Bipolaris oryzae ATCC 44560 TaxID=930090 RepID=W6YXD7_COCMI|nr:uncharacterized protein COCMIDRAFT_99172 [Bipolaris oryzae ATCC 44560]EUC44077.1 hypothetical protein COCMIDRAFT_99172 [Bipolaris oryzae ATCC 44560]